jgi:CheY-like chemotaxis protein
MGEMFTPEAPPPRVLIADPDVEVRHVYEDVFQSLNCDLIAATDGRDALAKALLRPLSLVMTELQLPELDGYTLCEVLRRDVMTRTVPIIIVTADHAAIDRARAAGADTVLTKPISADVVIAAVHGLFEKPRELRERSRTLQQRVEAQLATPADLHPQSAVRRRRTLVRGHNRFVTTSPPVPPPQLFCPSCGKPLAYVRSYIGGVSAKHAEQWDYFTCASCGPFQYRVRTRRIRKLG